MTTTITHDTFDAALARVRAGQSEFLIATYTRAWGIGAKTIAQWEKAGLEVIAKDKDGKGFRMRTGKRRDYLLPGYLKEVTP